MMDKSHDPWRSKNPMDYVDKSSHRRVTTSEINDIVSGIPALRELFTDAAEENSVFFQESTDSLMYSSRFNNKGIEKKLKTEMFKEKIAAPSSDTDDDSESDQRHVESLSTRENLPSGSSAQNIDKKRRFAMSLATLASNPLKRTTIVKEGAISVLISLSSNPDELIQRCCSCAFSFLATEIFGRQHLLEEGAIAAIVSLTTSSSLSNQIVKNNCCRALCNICFEVGCEAKAIRDGILTAVLHVIASCPDMANICLQILLNITSVHEKYPRIEEVTDLLLQLSPYILNIDHEVSFLSILLNLSLMRNNQLRLVEDGCLRVVEKILKSPILKLRSIAANIFGNFTTDSRSKNKLIEGNAIQTMLDMMRDEDEGIRIVAVKSFYNLAKDQQFRQKMLHSDAVSVVIVMSRLHFDDIQFGRNVMKVLKLLSSETGIVMKLIEEGVILGLKHLLSKNDVIIRQYCVASMCFMFQSEGALESLIQEGAVEVLILLASNEKDYVVNEWCCYALYCLSIHKFCPSSIIRENILPCLIRLCKTPSERTRYFCVATLAYISQIPDVDSSDAIATVVEMMKNEKNSVTQKNCAVTLYNMADDNNNCAIMLDAGALLHIVELTQVELSSTKMKCAAILSRLSLHEKYYDQFAQYDVLRVLLNLCSVDHIMTQRRLVIAISNLSQNDNLRDELLLLKPVPFIISMAAKRDENLRRGCASIFCNLAYKEGSEKSLVNAGIVPSLLVTAMITSDQMQAKVICVKALVNLMADKSTFKLMAKEGVIWGLSSLALLDHFELSQMCAQALCSFSYDYSRDMLASPSSIKAVLQFIGLDETELQRAGARTLTNMLMQTTDMEMEFRKSAVENMSFLASNTDSEICDLCVICLCYASQSDICRELIVTSGMLTKIGGGNIFTDHKLSFAYLALIENVANDASVRNLMLNACPNFMMSRFMKIVEMKDKNLHEAVARAIYALSCSHDNISKMAEYNILQLIKILWDDRINNEEESKIYEENKKIQDEIIMKEIKDMKIKGAKIPENYATVAPLVQIDHLLLACLYNLSTCPKSQNKLVTDGFIDIVMKMWEIAQKDKKICLLACYAVYHMACGPTSSARLVSSGCAPILCFLYLSKKQNLIEYKGYVFPIDLKLRCSMAIRNLMCVVSNQEELVRAGCVDALVTLAHDAESELSSSLSSNSKAGVNAASKPKLTSQNSSLNNSDNNSNNDNNSTATMTSNVNSNTIINKKNSTQSNIQMIIQNVHNVQNSIELLMLEETRQHCAAALRNLTFNKSFRHDLNNRKGAITVLLDDINADMKDENFPIDYDLLCELEAESWQNGSRTKGITEGRATPISPALLNTTLLSVIQKVDLDITVKSAILQKYRVTVELEEPKIEQGSDSCDALEENVSTLTIFDNNEDNSLPLRLLSAKMEWNTLDIKAALNNALSMSNSPNRKQSTYLDSLGVSSGSSTSTTANVGDDKLFVGASAIGAHSALNSHQEKEEEQKNKKTATHRLSVPKVTMSKSTDVLELRRNSDSSLPEVRYKNNSMRENNKKKSGNLSRKNSGKFDLSVSTDLPPIVTNDTTSKRNSVDKKIRTKNTMRAIPKKEENFNNLVSFINHNKRTKGDISEVLNKWLKISK